MSNTQHTPGPWRYEPIGQVVWGRSVGGCRLQENDHMVTDVRGWGHLQYLPNGKEVQDANGRLIAAAPELLEALIEERRVRLLGQEDDVHWESLRDMRRAACAATDAAIAKATGGANE